MTTRFFAPSCLGRLVALIAFVASSFGISISAEASIFAGTLHYTHFAGGGPNVLKVGFTYDDAGAGTLTYGAITGVATLVGADGILFAPNGNLIVTSNSVGSVYRLDSGTGAVLQTVATADGTPNFHMAVDPTATKLYSSNTYTRGGLPDGSPAPGPLSTWSFGGGGALSAVATGSPILPTALAGVGDYNVTQLAFDPSNGNVMYTSGFPNSNGSIGLFTFGAPNTTERLVGPGAVPASHGIVYDPFTGLMTLFGGGQVATLDASLATSAAITGSLKQYDVPGVGDFDQGAVDGFGHAFIAGSGAITMIDYSVTGDITSPLNLKTFIRFDDGLGTGFGSIDDIAPLVGPGGGGGPGVPEPASLIVFGFLFALFGVYTTRSR